MKNALVMKDIEVSVEGKKILNGVNLEVPAGEIHVVMGPNGAGKSSLALTLMGHPKYKITNGTIILDDVDITKLSATERAKKGLFLSFQYPSEVAGVTLNNFLRTAHNSIKKEQLDVLQSYKLLKQKMEILHMDQSFLKRSINEGFSGGEKKKTEILQLLFLEPKYAILDECDSGLDMHALKIVGQGIQSLKSKDRGMLIITHYARLLDYIKPDKISILKGGKIIKSGDKNIIKEIEEKGF